MTPENFCYWLQGCFELNPQRQLTTTQVQQIKDHLELIFDRQTPRRELITAAVDNPDAGLNFTVSC